MIRLKKRKGQGFYEFEISGKIDTYGMQRFSDKLRSELRRGRKMKLLGEYHEIPGFKSFKALKETMQMKALALQGIGKYAILTNKKWIKKAIKIGNKLMPKIPMKAFKPSQRIEAEAWLTA